MKTKSRVAAKTTTSKSKASIASKASAANKSSVANNSSAANKASIANKAKGKEPVLSSWPNKRNILFRPDRYKYIKKIDAPLNCVFCEAAKNKISFESLCIFKSSHSMIVLNKYPYNSGHLLVLPLQHIGDILKLSEAQYLDLMATVKLAIRAVQRLYLPSAMNLGMNHGATAGAGIPDHLHFHIIPRWSGDLNFFPLIAETKVVIETLEQTYQQFIGYFKKESV